jgi:hypothetical protein
MGAITRSAANNFTTGGVILPEAINDASVASVSDLSQVNTGGAFTEISEQTASGSSSISFTSGIDGTYPIYKLEFIDIHPSGDGTNLEFQASSNGGSSYGINVTASCARTYSNEADTLQRAPTYGSGWGLSSSTNYQSLSYATGIENKNSICGTMFLYEPSSTTYYKQFLSHTTQEGHTDYAGEFHISGYYQTTSAINALSFRMNSGNIDTGTIRLWGMAGS